MSESKSLCMIPWLHRFTNEQGLHQLCCSGVGEANVLRDAHGKPLHISQQLTDPELLNSPDLKAIRLSMMRGEWPAACERCRQAEEAGAESVRRHIKRRFGKWTDDALRRTHEDGALDNPQVRYADIRLGNVCNLTCRMCGPKASRLWTDHYNQMQPLRYILPVAELTDLRENNWVKHQPVQWLIDQCLPSIESLHFAGGEPLIIPELVEALETFIRSGRADEIDLSFNTNITVLPDKVTRLWPHFRSVSIICSIDGFGALNDYIRRPSDWEDIDRNLRLLDKHFKEWKLRSVHCNTTVQLYNILQLGELYDYLATNFENITPVPQLTPLFYPGYLSIQILPEIVKAIVRGRLHAVREKAQGRLQPRSTLLLNSIDGVLAHMEGPERRLDLAEFLSFSEKSDRQFGDSWRRACPELASLLFGGHKNRRGSTATIEAGH